MAGLTATQATEDLRASMEAALASGLSRQDIIGMVNTVAKNGKQKIYEKLPDGAIDLPSAARKYGVNSETMRRWLDKGKVPVIGRLRGPAQGGGFLVMWEDDLVRYINQPVPQGRPRKND